MILARHRLEHRDLTISLDESDGHVEIQQTRERFAHHRSENHVAADDNMIDVFLSNVFEHRLKCRQISMDVVDCSNAHGIALTKSVALSEY